MMITAHKKFSRAKQRKKIPNTILLLAVLALGLLAWFLLNSNLRIKERRQQAAAKLAEIETALAAQQEQKQRWLGLLQRDQPSYLEKEARLRFNLRKPGEEVVVIINEPSSTSPPASFLPVQAQNWWQKIMDWLGF